MIKNYSLIAFIIGCYYLFSQKTDLFFYEKSAKNNKKKTFPKLIFNYTKGIS